MRLKPARKSAEDVLRELVQSSAIAIHSTPALVGSVETAAAKDDKKRKEKGDRPLRRKSGLIALPGSEVRKSLQLAPWHLLHNLAHALSLSRQGAGRGLAEHWGSLKYSQALTSVPETYIRLSSEGKGIARYYKQLQSRELAQGFALALARHVLGQRHPDHFVSIVSADIVIRAGWPKRSLGYPYQPDFFAEVWKPGEPSLVYSMGIKGNHGRGSDSYKQLAACSAHVEAMHIGTWGQAPCFIFSTEFSAEGPVTTHCLHTSGEGGRPPALPEYPLKNLDNAAEDANIMPGVQPPSEGDEVPDSEPGFHVQFQRYPWFHHVLARTATAGVAAFAGDGDAIAQYLTTRQGSKRYTAGLAHPTTGSVKDAAYELLGIPFVGTDHVFRLNDKRVEAFSGVAQDLFALLSPQAKDKRPLPGRVEQYRREIYDRRGTWPVQIWDEKWEGPVSVHEDGTVLAIRLLRL
ncbi:hypothetical protein [Streptosporangium saharense]|uniref:hypothetical protein n=1 Tax=Streptosporangium saharense TaxID=1706840 RepID=UPI001C879CBD|nr:hypothetical protein [Streptosporangium saharense]